MPAPQDTTGSMLWVYITFFKQIFLYVLSCDKNVTIPLSKAVSANTSSHIVGAQNLFQKSIFSKINQNVNG